MFSAAMWDRQSAGALASVEQLQQRTVDLLEADQVMTDGVVTFYKRGTNVVLMVKDVEGSTCATDVSLIG